MPTATGPGHGVRAPGQFRAKAPAISIVLAAIATLGVVFAMLRSADDEPAQMQSVAAQPNTVSRSVAAPVPTPAAALSPTPVAPQPKPAILPMDDHGFVDSTARCDPAQHAVAIARTARSAMVVCRKADGTHEYTGTRLSDGAFLRLDDVRPIPAGFEARNGGTTYRLSATELVVITGEDLLSRDPIVEYRAG
ncbi:MAG: hypothetical protein K0U76_16620 [Actinomycetia bacterium]|nr:hypothetical protein [Actinomycetes bacterium]MCH9702971.1 hypothetical protein [Actinomycetes bacterium]MCH9760192.1 hypothetical protein [Actinomycetes bacterium]